MRLLLDSNAYSEFMRGNRQVRELVRAAEEVLLSAVVVGEQLFGFRPGTTLRAEPRGAPLFSRESLCILHPRGTGNRGSLLPHYGVAQGEGAPNPDDDVWIAAHASETGADLLSADTHFEQVDGIAWLQLPTAQ